MYKYMTSTGSSPRSSTSSSSSSSSPPYFDSVQFKIAQRQRWDSAAPGWKEWWETLETGAKEVSARLIELAEITSGQKILDVATGIGEPAVTAARKLVDVSTGSSKNNNNYDNTNNRGHVLATDISSQMLKIAKQRAAATGLQDIIEFREGDAEMLEIPDSSFDVAVCRWGLMFMPNLTTVLSHIWRALVSEGRFVCAVWAEASKVPFISFPIDIVMRELQIPPSNPGAPGPFALADISILLAALHNVGFTSIHSERLGVTIEFATVKDYINYIKSISVPIADMLSKESIKRQEEVWSLVTEQVKNNHASHTNQRVKMDNACICVAAKKP
jgi:enediyne biosynthesis protein CalE5